MSTEKYITFRKHEWFGLSKSRKTQVWHVDSSNGNVEVGVIKWHGPWRKYCFFPSGDMLFDQHCLRMIATFIEDETREHMSLRKHHD